MKFWQTVGLIAGVAVVTAGASFAPTAATALAIYGIGSFLGMRVCEAREERRKRFTHDDVTPFPVSSPTPAILFPDAIQPTPGVRRMDGTRYSEPPFPRTDAAYAYIIAKSLADEPLEEWEIWYIRHFHPLELDRAKWTVDHDLMPEMARIHREHAKRHAAKPAHGGA